MKTGLFFGSFNPVHIGHLIIAQTMAETTDLKEVWFIVSPQNPLKKSGNLLHEFDRYDMVEAAIADNYHFKVSDVEFHMPKPSYTVDTFAYLTEKHPDHDFKLIIGEDNLTSFSKWKNHQELLERFGLYVYPRPMDPAGREGVREFTEHPNTVVVDAPLLNISATFIRDLIHEDKSIKYLVPEAVEEMIRLRKLYR